MTQLDAYKLKVIALFAMFTNHMVIAWWLLIPLELAFPMYGIGGLTFPIMAFFVVEGYRHTSNFKRYILRILLVGVIATPFHYLTLGRALAPSLNIMFTIALSLGVLVLYDKIKYRAVFWTVLIFVVVPLSLFFEWSLPGVFMVLLFHIIKREKLRRILPPIMAVVINLALSLVYLIPGMELPAMGGLMSDVMFGYVSLTFMLGMLLAPVLLLRYNGERGPNTKVAKWMFYVFYPLHLAVLALGMPAFGYY